MTYNQWETEFITSSKLKYGEKIIPHVERLVPSCLKLAMLCESFETKDPNALTLFQISEASLSCAISMIDKLFFPSIAYLLENEVVMYYSLRWGPPSFLPIRQSASPSPSLDRIHRNQYLGNPLHRF